MTYVVLDLKYFIQISILSNVYNVTAYLDYHPGGWDEFIKGAGKDATDMFNDVHR